MQKQHLQILYNNTSRGNLQILCSRLLSSSPTDNSGGEKSKGWLGKILDKAGGEVAVGPHAAKLSPKTDVYEMQSLFIFKCHRYFSFFPKLVHKVKPRYMEQYIQQYSNFLQLLKAKGNNAANLVGSWTVEIGDQDEAIHIWRYDDYTKLNEATTQYRNDKNLVEFRQERNKMIDHRTNLIMMKFGFWADPDPRKFFGDSSIYELRTYSLRPGNLIEWGNLWARGIKFRQLNNEAVCGWFEQMGHLYTVHHLWNYKDMHTRKETREAAWRHPGWDENVSYTVPLIRKMKSRILVPTPFSPLQ